MLGGLVELRDGLPYLTHPGALLARGGADFRDDVGHALDGADHLAHGGARLVSQHRALLHHGAAGANQLLDGLGLGCRALRQVAHLAGHHGKASALLARAGGFHGGVQGQDIGLKRDAVDHTNDVGNLLAAAIDVVHGADHLRHHVATLRGHLAGAGRQAAGLRGVVGVVANGGAQLLHAGSRFLQRAGLGFGAGRQVLIALGNLVTGGRHTFGTAAHRAQAFRQALAKTFHGLAQGANLVVGSDVHRPRQVALGQEPQRGAELLHRFAHQSARGVDQHHRQDDQRGQHAHPQPDQHGAGVFHHFRQRRLGHDHPVPGLVAFGGHKLALLRASAQAGRPGHLQLAGLVFLGQLGQPGFAFFGFFIHHQGTGQARCAPPRRAGGHVHRIHRAGFKQLLRAHDLGQPAQDGAHVGADEQNANRAVALANGLLHRHVFLAKQAGAADVRLAFLHQRIGGVVAVQQGFVGALAILLFEGCGHADEVITRARKNGGNGARTVFGEAVHPLEVAVQGHPLKIQHGFGLAVCTGLLLHAEVTRKARLEQHKVPLGLLLSGFIKALHQGAHLGRILVGIVARYRTKVPPDKQTHQGHGGEQDQQQAHQRCQGKFESDGALGYGRHGHP